MKTLIAIVITTITLQCCKEPYNNEEVKTEYLCFKLKTRCVCERIVHNVGYSFETDCSEVEGFAFRK